MVDFWQNYSNDFLDNSKRCFSVMIDDSVTQNGCGMDESIQNKTRAEHLRTVAECSKEFLTTDFHRKGNFMV
jgi:hypothetical protein